MPGISLPINCLFYWNTDHIWESLSRQLPRSLLFQRQPEAETAVGIALGSLGIRFLEGPVMEPDLMSSSVFFQGFAYLSLQLENKMPATLQPQLLLLQGEGLTNQNRS